MSGGTAAGEPMVSTLLPYIYPSGCGSGMALEDLAGNSVSLSPSGVNNLSWNTCDSVLASSVSGMRPSNTVLVFGYGDPVPGARKGRGLYASASYSTEFHTFWLLLSPVSYR